jgi:protein TonB
MTGSIAHRNLASPRVTALAGIVALHVLVAYLLLTAFVQAPAAHAPPSLEFVSLEPPPPPATPTPPIQPGPTTKPPTPREIPIPPVDFTPPVPPDVSAPPGTVVPPQQLTGPTVREPIRVLGRHWLPSSEAYYPPRLIREGVQGSSLVRVCVDEAGRLSGAPVLERSSGSAGLDEGALNVARAGRYARAVRGDTPVANCYLFRIVFKTQ